VGISGNLAWHLAILGSNEASHGKRGSQPFSNFYDFGFLIAESIYMRNAGREEARRRQEFFTTEYGYVEW